jgi:hypothetical protein
MTLFDWFLNHDTWKPLAELLGDWRTIASTGFGVVTVATAVTKKGREFVGQAWAAMGGRSLRKGVDLRFVADDRETYWCIGTRGNEKAMMFWGTFHRNQRFRRKRLFA